VFDQRSVLFENQLNRSDLTVIIIIIIIIFIIIIIMGLLSLSLHYNDEIGTKESYDI
jgi:hypothetical protein